MPLPRTIPCPVCGKDIPAKAKSCHHCGACDKTGWNEETTAADGLDLPDENFDYEKFVQDEFGEPRKVRGKAMLWKITATVLLVLTTILIFFNALFR